METAALCKPIQRSADLLRIPGTWVLTGLGKLLAVLGSFPQFRTASTTASHTSFWRFLECQSIEATLTQNGHLTHHEIPSFASLRPGGHFPRIGWPVSPEYAVTLLGWFMEVLRQTSGATREVIHTACYLHQPTATTAVGDEVGEV